MVRSMQRLQQFVIYVLMAVCLFLSVFDNTVQTVKQYLPKQANIEESKRACWISYIDIQKYLSDKNEAAFRAKVHAMYNTVKKNGMNTVIVHARAMGDAFYPSEYFPYSEYLSKNRKQPTYDPYEILVSAAHDEGLKFEAWVNPYRISIGTETTESFMQTPYYVQYQSMIIEYESESGTCLSLDPENVEAQQLVVDGVSEIMTRYPVDGIHFDDYFYIPGMKDSCSVEEKKQAVNKLVHSVYCVIKEKNKDCEFGISPAGNPDYARSQGADIDTWVSEEGYIDYIMPQIYWTDHYRTESGEVQMFSERSLQWMQLRTNPHIKLYIGLALYRAGEVSDTDVGWSMQNNNLAEQWSRSDGMGYDGFALFRYAYLEESSAQTELENLQTYLKKQTGILTSDVEAYLVYTVKMQTLTWQEAKLDGVVAGFTNQSLAVEAIRIQLGSLAPRGNVRYVTENGQGQGIWKRDGQQTGSDIGEETISGIRINLTGEIAQQYDIIYRVYINEHGWTEFEKNGSYAGGGMIQAIQVKLIKKIE